jgi:chromosome partitioning protein
MYVVTPGQQKGGVGKTTITANLAAISGDFGLKVLAVDLDPQSHLTLSFGQQTRPGYSTGELLNHSLDQRPSFDEVLIRDVVPNVDLLPGDERALERAENDIAADPIGGMSRLRRLLESVGERYQLCFIDTPPKVEGLSVLAMVASDGVVIVSEPQTLAFASTKVYAAKVEQVAASPLNPDLRILGVLLNKVVEGEESTFITKLLRETGLHVFETGIPASKLASKAAASGVPAALANRNHGIGKVYRAVADEISDRLTEVIDDHSENEPQAVAR